MPATLIDMPTSYASTGISRRPDVVYNTPFQKSAEDNRTGYNFSQGFYYTAQTQIQHPVIELKKSEAFRLTLKFIDQLNDLLPKFQGFDLTVLGNAFVEIVQIVISNPFQRAVFERTPDNSLMLKATYNDHHIYLEIDYEPDEPNLYEAVLNAYQDKKHVFFAAGSIQSVFERLFAIVQPSVLA